MNAASKTPQSQVWWSWPGGIGWPTPIPLKGGRRAGCGTRKNRKHRKANRKASRRTNMRRMNMRRNTRRNNMRR